MAALSSGQGGTTTDRTLNRLQYGMSNIAEDITTAATNDAVLMLDASDNYKPKWADATNVKELMGLDPASRIVTTTATSLGLTVTQHAERIVLVNTNSTVANTFTLPVATGSGNRFTIINNIVQTQGTVVVAANGTDILTGKAKAFDTTAVTAQAEVFKTSATSDKISFNLTTTGGLGYDTVVAFDISANTWLVDVEYLGSGNLATPFSET